MGVGWEVSQYKVLHDGFTHFPMNSLGNYGFQLDVISLKKLVELRWNYVRTASSVLGSWKKGALSGCNLTRQIDDADVETSQ
eukprot:1844844-Amphidinium_carterae.1